MELIKVITGLFFFIQLVIALPLAEVGGDQLFEGYAVGELIWEGPVYPNGTNTTLHGTAETIYNQIMLMNPEYQLTTANTNSTSVSGLNHHDVTAQSPDYLTCNLNGYYEARLSTIWDGIRYLKRLGATCYVGSHTCARTSCSYNAAIYLCNDRDETYGLSCDTVGDYAYYVAHECAKWDSNGVAMVKGKAVDTDRWNVVVAWAKC